MNGNIKNFLILCLVLGACKDNASSKVPVEIQKDDYFISLEEGDINAYYSKDNSRMTGAFIVLRDSIKQEELNLKNGYLNGNYKQYYPDGALASSVDYKMGKKEGEDLFYFRSGTLKRKSTFKDNELVGKSIQYYEDGSLHIEREQIAGEWVSKIYQNGKLMNEEYDIRLGRKKIGVSKIYDANGKTRLIIGFEMNDNVMNDEVLYLLDEEHKVIDSINPKTDPMKAMQLMLLARKGM